MKTHEQKLSRKDLEAAYCLEEGWRRDAERQRDALKVELATAKKYALSQQAMLDARVLLVKALAQGFEALSHASRAAVDP